MHAACPFQYGKLVPLFYTCTCRLYEVQSLHAMEQEVILMEDALAKDGVPVCLSHSDFWHTNVFWNETNGNSQQSSEVFGSQ